MRSNDRDPRDQRGRRDERDDRGRAHLVRPEAIGLPGGAIIDPAEIRDALERLSGGANLLGPVTAIDFLPPDHRLIFRCVVFDAKIASGTSNGTYYKVKGGTLAHHKPALRALAMAAGVADVPELTVRVDDGSIQHYATVRSTVRIKTMDGEVLPKSAMKTVDLRDGSAEAESLTKNSGSVAEKEKVLAEARRFIERLAESKARNAAIRDALCLRGSYSPEEAARPFVFPFLAYFPPDTAEVRMVRALHALQAPASIYGAALAGLRGPARAEEAAGVLLEERAVVDPRVIEAPRDRELPDTGRYDEERAPREREPARRERPREPAREERRPRRAPSDDDAIPKWMEDAAPFDPEAYDGGRR